MSISETITGLGKNCFGGLYQITVIDNKSDVKVPGSSFINDDSYFIISNDPYLFIRSDDYMENRKYTRYYLQCPVINNIANDKEGIRIEWNEVSGAQYYQLERKEADGNWKIIAKVSNDQSSFVDLNVINNNLYYYRMKVSDGTIGIYSDITTRNVYVASPVIATLDKSSAGILLKWSKIDGADEYQVFRKTNNDDMVRVATVSELKYTDKQQLENGNQYEYYIRAIVSNGNTVYESDLSAPQMTYWVNAPVNIKVTNNKSGIAVKWDQQDNVTGYDIYRSSNNGSYYKITSVVNKNSYTDRTVQQNGAKYSYKLYAYLEKDGQLYYSKASEIISTYRLENTSIISAEDMGDGCCKIEYQQNAKGNGYQIQISNTSDFSDKTTIRVSTNNATKKKISGLSVGKTYYIRIRPYKKVNDVIYYGSWSSSQCSM